MIDMTEHKGEQVLIQFRAPLFLAVRSATGPMPAMMQDPNNQGAPTFAQMPFITGVVETGSPTSCCIRYDAPDGSNAKVTVPNHMIMFVTTMSNVMMAH
jgi:hypothetical protein